MAKVGAHERSVYLGRVSTQEDERQFACVDIILKGVELDEFFKR